MKLDSATWSGLLLAGRFEITAKIGEGGMGLVYRATDRKSGKQVVVKAPLASQLEMQGGAERFLREVRSQQNLKHEHIVPVLEVGEHEGIPYAVMPYLGGGNLKDALPVGPDGKRGPLAPVVLRAWLSDIAAALDEVHRAGFMHRDIKPANILFDDQGQGYLSDFGVVKALAAAESNKRQTQALTAAGLVLGTPEYMAPELIMGEPCDGRVDQFALAVSVYEVLSGRVPVEGPNPGAVLVKLVSQPLIPLCEANSRVSRELAAAVHKGMEKDPKQRFTNCAAFAQAVLGAIPAAQPQGAEQKAVAVAQAVGAVTVVVACPVCQARLKAPPSLAGKLVKCRACGEKLRIPGEEPLVLTAEPTRKPPPTAQRNGDDIFAGGVVHATPGVGEMPMVLESLDSPARRPRKQGSSGKLMVFGFIGGIVVVAGVAIAIIASQSKTPETTTEIVKKNPEPIDDKKEKVNPTPKSFGPAHLVRVADVSVYAGESKTIEVAVDRRGYRGEIMLTPANVPAGQLTAEPIKIPANLDRGTLRVAATDAAAEGSHRIDLTVDSGGVKVQDDFVVRIQKPSLRLEFSPVLAVKAGGSDAALGVKVIRTGCNDRAVELSLRDAPAEVFGDTAKPAQVARGIASGGWRLKAAATAQRATHRLTVVAAIPALNIKVEEPVRVDVEAPQLKLKLDSAATLHLGRIVDVPVTIERDGYVGAMQVKADKLPTGITAVSPVIPDGTSAGRLTLSAGAEAQDATTSIQITLMSNDNKPLAAPSSLLLTVKAREGLFRSLPGGSRGVALNPNGSRIAIVSDEGSSAKVIDLNNGSEMFTTPRRGSPIQRVELATDGRRVLVETREGVWAWDNQKEMAALPGHQGGHFSRFGDRVMAFHSEKKLISIVDVGGVDSQPPKSTKTALQVHGAALSADGSYVATRQGEFGTVRVIDLGTGKEAFELGKPEGGVADMFFSPDGNALLVREGSNGGSVRVWDGKSKRQLAKPAGTNWQAAAFVGKGEKFVTLAANNGTLVFSTWGLSGGAALGSHNIPGIKSAVLSPDGSRIAALDNDGRIRIYDSVTGALATTLAPPGEAVKSMVFSANGRRLAATGAVGKTLGVWSVED